MAVILPFIPIAIQLIPVVMGLIESATKIIQAIRSEPGTPEEVRAKLYALERRLLQTQAEVAAVQFRDIAPPTPPSQPPTA